ncbi:UNVERIFIED_CONTAM: hypothetical protein FKN15_039795 [Acipenser sinensis]
MLPRSELLLPELLPVTLRRGPDAVKDGSFQQGVIQHLLLGQRPCRCLSLSRQLRQQVAGPPCRLPSGRGRHGLEHLQIRLRSILGRHFSWPLQKGVWGCGSGRPLHRRREGLAQEVHHGSELGGIHSCVCCTALTGQCQ